MYLTNGAGMGFSCVMEVLLLSGMSSWMQSAKGIWFIRKECNIPCRTLSYL